MPLDFRIEDFGNDLDAVAQLERQVVQSAFRHAVTGQVDLQDGEVLRGGLLDDRLLDGVRHFRAGAVNRLADLQQGHVEVEVGFELGHDRWPRPRRRKP